MRILLLAYEFPPVLAAQALRWHYLARELAALGHRIDILTPAWPGPDRQADRLHHGMPGLRIERCYAGPFVATASWLARRRNGGRVGVGVGPASMAERVYRAVRSLLDQVLVPDVRTEWWPFAWRAARTLWRGGAYDVVLSSHEPGVDLLLGLQAKRRWRMPWVVDLADPVVHPRTPAWRRGIDARLERAVWRGADLLLVTTPGVADLLRERHGGPGPQVLVLPQGFDAAIQPGEADCAPDLPPDDRLTLVFTGNFYRGFRDPAQLLAALRSVPGVRLVVAGDMTAFQSPLAALGSQVWQCGRLDHAACLALQRRADVLLNIGNAQPYQVPGKLYEYLGAGRPILHLANHPEDDAGAWLQGLRRGNGAANRSDAIADALRTLHGQWQRGELDRNHDLGTAAVREHSWQSGAARLSESLVQLLHHAPAGGGPAAHDGRLDGAP